MKNFFIIGAQRSGTTLLRLILNAHSKIAIPEESEFLMPLLKKKNLHRRFSECEYKILVSYILKNEVFKLWNYDLSQLEDYLMQRESVTLKELILGIFNSYCVFEGKQIWGDKTPMFFRKIDVLHAMFPNAVFIHTIRDGRDVFNSWRKIDKTKNNTAVAALDWCYKNYKIDRSLDKIDNKNKISIRYEDLLQSPEEIIREICHKINVKYEEDMLNFHTKSEYYIGKHHSSLIFEPINKNNTSKWKQNLTSNELKTYNFLSQRFLEKYKYEVNAKPTHSSDYLLILFELLKGLPFKIFQVLRAKYLWEKALQRGAGTDYISHGLPPVKTWNSDSKLKL